MESLTALGSAVGKLLAARRETLAVAESSAGGLINAALGRYKIAIRAWEQALEVDPHLAGAKERIEELRQILRGKEL